MKISRITLLGLPGCGKGTISQFLLADKKLKMKYISSALLIQKYANETNNKFLKDDIKKGNLISDELVNNLVLNAVNENKSTASLIIDGFPRTLPQAKFLESIRVNKEEVFGSTESKNILTHVFHIDVPVKDILDRINNRWVHPTSGRVYNSEFNPPKVFGIDDITGEPLEKRMDDKAIDNRLLEYCSRTEPLLNYYSGMPFYHRLSGENSFSIFNKICQILNEKESEDLLLQTNQ